LSYEIKITLGITFESGVVFSAIAMFLLNMQYLTFFMKISNSGPT